MKEMYIAPELQIVTFVPVESLASGYMDGYASAIGGGVTRNGVDGASNPGDIDITLPNNEEGTPF